MHWFLKCWGSLLPSPIWPLPVCLDSYAIPFLQNRALLSPPDIGCCLHFHSPSSFLLELLLHSSPVPCCVPTILRSSFVSVISFCLFILFMGFSRPECWSGLPWPSPVTKFCQNFPPWPFCLGWPYRAWLIVSLSLDNPVIQVISLVSFLWLWFSFCLPSGW